MERRSKLGAERGHLKGRKETSRKETGDRLLRTEVIDLTKEGADREMGAGEKAGKE